MIGLFNCVLRRSELTTRVYQILTENQVLPKYVFGLKYTTDRPVQSTSTFNLESENEIPQYREDQIICHSCKQPGHFARNCPTVATLCYRCGQTGHLSNNCPSAKTCYRCGSEAHLARNCPKNICYRCMKPGHITRDCPEDKTCYRCGKTGHIAKDCSAVNNIENISQ